MSDDKGSHSDRSSQKQSIKFNFEFSGDLLGSATQKNVVQPSNGFGEQLELPGTHKPKRKMSWIQVTRPSFLEKLSQAVRDTDEHETDDNKSVKSSRILGRTFSEKGRKSAALANVQNKTISLVPGLTEQNSLLMVQKRRKSISDFQEVKNHDITVKTSDELALIKQVFGRDKREAVANLTVGGILSVNDQELQLWRSEYQKDQDERLKRLTLVKKRRDVQSSIMSRIGQSDGLASRLANPLLKVFDMNLKKLLNTLKQEQRFVDFLDKDFGLSLVKNQFVREPLSIDAFNSMQKIKRWVKQFEKDFDPRSRHKEQYKEIITLIKEMPWFKKLGRHYGDEDAYELLKHAKIKRIDMNQVVQRPLETDNNYYFILNGKVGIGSLNLKNMKDFFVTIQSTLLTSVVEQRQRELQQTKTAGDAQSSYSRRSSRSRRDQRKAAKREVMQYIGKFFVKAFLKRNVSKKNSLTGEIETFTEEVPHPMYQLAHDCIEKLDMLMCEDMQIPQNPVSKALETEKTVYQAEAEYNMKYANARQQQVVLFGAGAARQVAGPSGENTRSRLRSALKRSVSSSFDDASSESSYRAGNMMITLEELDRQVSKVSQKKVFEDLDTIRESPTQHEDQSPQPIRGRLAGSSKEVEMQEPGEQKGGFSIKLNQLSDSQESKSSKNKSGISSSKGGSSVHDPSEQLNNSFSNSVSSSSSSSDPEVHRIAKKTPFLGGLMDAEAKKAEVQNQGLTPRALSSQNIVDVQVNRAMTASLHRASTGRWSDADSENHLNDLDKLEHHSFHDDSSHIDSKTSKEETDFLSASTVQDSELQIEDEDGNPKYVVIKTMGPGMGFGETSLTAADKKTVRMAYVHTLKPTFFLVIEQTYYKQMKRHNEYRQQKILFAMLREIYLLKEQSHFVIKKFSEVVQQQDEVVRAKQQLYREGDPADYVYIVVRGSFLITKKVVKNATTHQLFDENFDPKTIKVKLKAEDVDLKAAQIKEKLKIKVDRWQLQTYGDKSVLGDDDVILGNKYMTAATCTSQTAEVMRIPREEFLRLIRLNEQLLDTFRKTAEDKRHKFKLYIEQKRMVAAINSKLSSAKLEAVQKRQSVDQKSSASEMLTKTSIKPPLSIRTQVAAQPSARQSQTSGFFMPIVTQSVTDKNLYTYRTGPKQKKFYETQMMSTLAETRREKLAQLESGLRMSYNQSVTSSIFQHQSIPALLGRQKSEQFDIVVDHKVLNLNQHRQMFRSDKKPTLVHSKTLTQLQQDSQQAQQAYNTTGPNRPIFKIRNSSSSNLPPIPFEMTRNDSVPKLISDLAKNGPPVRVVPASLHAVRSSSTKETKQTLIRPMLKFK